jgi:predicted GNAT family acetyltransferase
MTDPGLKVADNAGARRYELTVDGNDVGFVDYHLRDGVMILAYVEIDPAFGGRGYGGRLTAAVLDDCRTRGLKVVPECPFIARYMREHPEYEDLRLR